MLVRINSQDINTWWPRCLPFLQMAADCSNGKDTVEGYREMLRGKPTQLWACVDDDGEILMALMTGAVHFANYKTLRGICIGGKDRDKWLLPETLDSIEAWAKDQGYGGVEWVCREGFWKDLKGMGYKRSHVFCEKRL